MGRKVTPVSLKWTGYHGGRELRDRMSRKRLGGQLNAKGRGQGGGGSQKQGQQVEMEEKMRDMRGSKSM